MLDISDFGQSALAEHQAQTEVFYLLEHNPDESLNADLKRTIGSKVPARTKLWQGME